MHVRSFQFAALVCATAALACACEAIDPTSASLSAPTSADAAAADAGALASAGDAAGTSSADAAASATADAAQPAAADAAQPAAADADNSLAEDAATASDANAEPAADAPVAADANNSDGQKADGAVAADAGAAPADISPPSELPPPAPVEKPDTAAIFGGDEVRTITLVYTAADYAAQQQDLVAQLGTFNSAGKPVQPGIDALPPELLKVCEGIAIGKNCSALSGSSKFNGMCTPYKDQLVCLPQGFWPGDKIPGVEAPPAPLVGAGGTPMYVPVTVVVGDKKWAKVRMRFKGNQSLQGAWLNGVAKLPFRLDFKHKNPGEPDAKSELFHGFEKLTFVTGRDDMSMLRDKVASEILRDRGVPAPYAAYYRVNIDVGDGKPFYAGLHTCVEDPSDVLPGRDLDAGKGNIYKPEGPGADWATFKQAAFVKKNNEKAADWSDVKAAMGTLHAVQSDAALWRKELEQRIDAKAFLRWLAVNTAIGNLDAYGHSPQNYYVVGVAKEAGRLHWVPWDHNLAFTDMPPPGAKLPTNFSVFAASDILHDDANYQWPLIRILLDDIEYRAFYKQELALATQGLYASDAFAARLAVLEKLILPHIYGPDGEKAPYSAIPALAPGVSPKLAAPLVAFAEQMHLAIALALEKAP